MIRPRQTLKEILKRYAIKQGNYELYTENSGMLFRRVFKITSIKIETNCSKTSVMIHSNADLKKGLDAVSWITLRDLINNIKYGRCVMSEKNRLKLITRLDRI